MLRRSAVIGTPLLLVLAMLCGIMSSFAKDHSMRVEAYNPEFAAERIAVSTTKFIASPAKGRPMELNTSTKGLSSTPASCQGISEAMTMMEPVKKMTRRNRVVWIAFGKALSGSLVSPAVTPISSVPEKAKFTVSMVVNTGIHPLGNNPSFTKFSNSGAWSYP